MTNTTDTQTAILTIIKNGKVKSTQRYASVELAENARAAMQVYLPGHTFGLITDMTDQETASTRGVTFEVASANGKVKHGIPSYGLARSFARRYATENNSVVIYQVIVTEDVEPTFDTETVYLTEEAALATAEA